jgi:hypothetical protein
MSEQKKSNAEWIAEYRKAQMNRQPSAEEIFEMVAAFGPGAEVVDVITGQKIVLPGEVQEQQPKEEWTVSRTLSDEVKGYRADGSAIKSWDWNVVAPNGLIHTVFSKKQWAVDYAASMNGAYIK